MSSGHNIACLSEEMTMHIPNLVSRHSSHFQQPRSIILRPSDRKASLYFAYLLCNINYKNCIML
jgi:hypothetical protein